MDYDYHQNVLHLDYGQILICSPDLFQTSTTEHSEGISPNEDDDFVMIEETVDLDVGIDLYAKLAKQDSHYNHLLNMYVDFQQIHNFVNEFIKKNCNREQINLIIKSKKYADLYHHEKLETLYKEINISQERIASMFFIGDTVNDMNSYMEKIIANVEEENDISYQQNCNELKKIWESRKDQTLNNLERFMDPTPRIAEKVQNHEYSMPEDSRPKISSEEKALNEKYFSELINDPVPIIKRLH
jgi:hypothetical protein